MRVLWVATKEPWPATDGGRLLLWNTLRSLRDLGVEVTLAAPYLGDPDARERCHERLGQVCRPLLAAGRPAHAALALIKAVGRRRPWTLERHRNRQVLRLVVAELEGGAYDVVVAEQIQALAQVPTALPAERTLPPIVLRAQNVESDLWRALAEARDRSLPVRWWLRRQARGLAVHEGRAVRRCDAIVALTEHDAAVLRRLAEDVGADPAVGARVGVIPATVDPQLPPGPELAGEPAVVLFGSSGWAPNTDGARTFVRECWPDIRRAAPAAVLHLFGAQATDGGATAVCAAGGIERHPAPAESATALARGSVLVVPLAVASGVRMKILEAWSRGVVVVASSVAARGLEAAPGHELLVADSPAQWAAAVRQALTDAASLRAAAHRRLGSTYAPVEVAQRWRRLFESLRELREPRSA